MKMMTKAILAFAAGLLAAGCQVKTVVPIDREKLAAFAPLPPRIADGDNPITAPKVDLGRMLYYETALSRDGSLSCNSCHNLYSYGADTAPVSTGFKGQRGNRQSPTVYHAAGHIAQFWDGRATTVEEQAKGPILNPVEMAMPDERTVVRRLSAIPAYRVAFRRAFPGEAQPISFDNVARAIGAFERGLVTPSRWDAYLRGADEALTTAEKKGLRLFLSSGCQICHSGAYLGGQSFQKAGLVKPWPNLTDPGRAAVTRRAEDQGVFKVPSLRNVGKTGPYFHDGRTTSLTSAVSMMSQYQLGKELTTDQVASMTVWLESLTGSIPEDYVWPPTAVVESQ